MLINKEETLKAINSIKKLTIEQKDGLEAAKLLVDTAHEVKAIPIDWLKKELIELQFKQVLNEQQLKSIYTLIAKWENSKE